MDLPRIVARMFQRVAGMVSLIVSRWHGFGLVLVSRHRDRWRGDVAYRRTLTAAVAALVGTLLPHPAVSAAIGVVIADRMTSSTYHQPLSGRWDDDFDRRYPFEDFN